MKKITLFITAAVLITGIASAQDLSAYNKDTLKNKMKIYSEMLKIADSYTVKAEAELKNVKFFKAQARSYLDSAYILSKKAEIDKSNAQLYILQFSYVYDLADKFIIKSDSLMAVVDAYKDTATIKNKDAETYYLQLVDSYQSMLESDTLNPVIYTVQLGAGNMDIDYFNKVSNLEIITPGDGIKRFITGAYSSKSEAIEVRQKMIDLGYYDAFIRSMDSLNY